MADTEYARLHITPFSPALLNAILPSSVLPNARNISYHSIQTFPEKSFGFVELPVMDAEKIKKKLNGSILKGTKVKIDKARPQKEIVVEEEEPERPKREKRKRKRDELPGVDIGERHVKRGWTTPGKDVKSKDKIVIKSKYTTGPECLFKTNLPPNVASKATKTDKKVDNKKRKPGKEAVVHEFAKTTKYATFLKSSIGGKKTKGVAEFVEGKGWVDEDGNLVEEAIRKRHKATAHAPEPIPAEIYSDSSSSENDMDSMDVDKKQPQLEIETDNSTSGSSSGSSSSESSSDEEEQKPASSADVQTTKIEAESAESADSSDEEVEFGVAQTNTAPSEAKLMQEESSSSDSSDESDQEEVKSKTKEVLSNSDSSSSEDSDSEVSSDSSDSGSEADGAAPQSAISNRSIASGLALSIKIPPSLTTTPVSTAVHPLEAIYKRAKTDDAEKPKPAAASFSFFGADGDNEDIEGETEPQVPLTPFTQKDFEYRGLRSAAPTPDTAHPNKRFVWPTENDEDEEEEEEHEHSSPIRKPATKEETASKEPETEFQKWFWENRGNADRSWKSRRRVVAKEKRQRENRKRQDRVV